MRIVTRVTILAIGLAAAGCAPERGVIVIDAPPVETAARAPAASRPPCHACQAVDIPASPDWPAVPWALRTGLNGRRVGTAALPPVRRPTPATDLP